MIKKLVWEAFTSQDRLKAIDEIKQLILRSDAYILNFNMFSDLAISISIEVEEKHIQKLHNELQKVVTLSEFDSTKINPQSDNEWMILMNISFASGTGNLKHEKPMVDG